MIPDLNQETENEVFRDGPILETQSEHVRRKDGLSPKGGDPWAPTYLYSPQPLLGTREAPRVELNKVTTKLTDFGRG